MARAAIGVEIHLHQGGKTMYARVTTVQFPADRVDEAIRIYRDSVVPSAKQQKGFKGVLYLTDRSTGKTMAIFLAETEADLTATETSGYLQEQAAKFAHIEAGQPTVEHFEVGVQAL
jgi:hypothetical protein